MVNLSSTSGTWECPGSSPQSCSPAGPPQACTGAWGRSSPGAGPCSSPCWTSVCTYMYKTPMMCLISLHIIQIKETEKIQRQSKVGMLYPNFSELRDFYECTMRSFWWQLVDCMGQSVSRYLCCQGLQIPSLSVLAETEGEEWLSTFRGMSYRSARGSSSRGQIFNTSHGKSRVRKSIQDLLVCH